jgi:2-phospho-L-lactate guanylyltransferase
MRAALIPVNGLADAKTRLSAVLDAQGRADLVLAMLSDVIAACAESGRFDLITVVSADSEVRWHAREQGAKPLAEPATLSGLNDSLTFGQRYLSRRMAAAELLILPADIPLARAEDLRAVVEALAQGPPRAVVVPSRDGGTNALALRPPEALPMRFGPGSADAHLAAASAAGVDAVALVNDRLALDVDAPADLDALEPHACGRATAAWLAAHAAEQRLA